MSSSITFPDLGKQRPEGELLLHAISMGPGAYMVRIESLLLGEIDWSYLVRAALYHGVSLLLARTLVNFRAGQVPDEILQSFEAHLLDNRERNRQLTGALFELMDALEGLSIRIIPFKVQGLGAIAYGDESIRRAGDIDFLVGKEHITKVNTVLEGLGYRELEEYRTGIPMSPSEKDTYERYQCEYACLRGGDGILFEPHWAIIPTTIPLAIDYPALFERATAIPLGGRKVCSLAPGDLLLVL